MRATGDREGVDRRSTWRVVADFHGYLYRVLRRRQRPVRFNDLPTDLKFQYLVTLLFISFSFVGHFVDAAWFGEIGVVLFVALFGSAWISIQRAKQDTARYTRAWTGVAGR